MPSGKYMSVKAGIIAEVEEDNIIDWDEVWDIVNQQLTIQASQYDASWIETKNTTKYDKVTIRIPNG